MLTQYDRSPVLLWFRRDLRVTDHAALVAAVGTGRPVIPVFIRDTQVDVLGAAPKWRLGQGLGVLDTTLARLGARLILRSGEALEVLRELVAETGAGDVYWSRAYDPQSVARDTCIKTALKAAGVTARSFGGHLLFEPWSVQTGAGSYYKVYSPFWRAVRGREVEAPLPAPSKIPAPTGWPESEDLGDWHLGAAMQRGAGVVARYARIGESAAQARLDEFVEGRIAGYGERRDFPGEDATSGMSPHLAWGEISPHQCWAAGQRALGEGKAGAETFLKELVWREFAYHLFHHCPEMDRQNWKPGWERFPWNRDASRPEVVAWQQGRTGIEIVDAGMRELYVTGLMHNRVRMIVASYLTKHLMTHWRIGQSWFEEHLIDWDPASNAMGWQWVAGCGPDASPFFRIFNPDTQAAKFDPDGTYRRRWLAEGQAAPGPQASDFFAAVPRAWGLCPNSVYPGPVMELATGRQRALSAYQQKTF